jgi:hypothetical protein
MSSKLSKKNKDYSIAEKRVTGMISFMLFGLLTYFYTQSLPLEGDLNKLVTPYLIGFISGFLIGVFSYRYPKVIHLSILALPLMFVGS